MQSNKEELKKTLLDLLLEDKEFRHAVAGAIGYKEILDRFARVEEEIRDLRKDMDTRFLKLEERVAKLEEDMNKRFLDMEERFNARFLKLEEMIAENQARNEERFLKLEERIVKVEEEIRDLRRDMQEGFKRHDQEFALIRKDIRDLRKDMKEIKTYIQRTSITLEEEARDVIQHRLKGRGISITISRLELADIEVDIYGVDTDLCIIGEVKTRATPNTIEEVDKEIEELCSKYPSYLRRKVIKAIYAMQVAEEAVKEAERRGIWVVTASRDLTPLIV